MKQVYSSKALFKGAFILTIAAIITKILSAVYRAPFQNIVGDIGFYIYQQVYPFYGIATVLSTTGFPVVISKLYMEQKQLGDEEKSRFLLSAAFLFLQIFGFICFLILFIGANRLANWMHDPQLAILLRVVSLVFLTFPIVSLMRGYFQGNGDMVPTALSQVGEQTVRILTILFLSYLFMKQGYSLYVVGSGAMFGAITGSIVSGLILFMFIWIRKQWKWIQPKKEPINSYLAELKRIFKALFFQGLMICVSGMLLILIQLADSLNLYALLITSGIEKETAKVLKGIFDRGQPLIQLGTVAATSMSLALVPLITHERFSSSKPFLHDKIQLAIKTSIIVGVGAACGLAVIIRPTNRMLFENSSGSTVLAVLSFVILFTSIILTVMAIMQGLGFLLFPALVVAAVFPIKYLLNVVFVPLYGIMGAAVSSLITLAIAAALLIIRLKKLLNAPLLTLRFLGIVCTAAVLMMCVLKAYLFVTDRWIARLDIGRFAAAGQALSAVCLGGITFLFVIIRGRIFREEELAFFPLGNKLRYFMARKDRG